MPPQALCAPCQKSAAWRNFPEAMLRACSGYPKARAGGLLALPKLAHQRLGLLLVA